MLLAHRASIDVRCVVARFLEGSRMLFENLSRREWLFVGNAFPPSEFRHLRRQI